MPVLYIPLNTVFKLLSVSATPKTTTNLRNITKLSCTEQRNFAIFSNCENKYF